MATKAQLRDKALRARRALGEALRAQKSADLLAVLQAWPRYATARCVCLYASFGSEVATAALIDASLLAAVAKVVLLPRVCADTLVLHRLPAAPGSDRAVDEVAAEAEATATTLTTPTAAGSGVAQSEATRAVKAATPFTHLHKPRLVELAPGALGMGEPQAQWPLASAAEVDLIVVPGVAFCRDGQRIGYGKGYYDRLLASAPSVPKVGLCFDAQLFPAGAFAADAHDISMDFIATESGVFATGRAIHG